MSCHPPYALRLPANQTWGNWHRLASSNDLHTHVDYSWSALYAHGGIATEVLAPHILPHRHHILEFYLWLIPHPDI